MNEFEVVKFSEYVEFITENYDQKHRRLIIILNRTKKKRIKKKLMSQLFKLSYDSTIEIQ
ncbi:hypothetical protein PPSC2_26340 (plasmid) [Paenibacillus polymyxa SC2]|uniref:Uncharacterized protein n=1 Tax=Paenibacillus polymyxa (strain SC2) TaxID=886882 RepID=E3EK57_PAEPS|nr:hypothetical protein PPSC2_26340 [Paenibacillus polymyxa SC2]